MPNCLVCEKELILKNKRDFTRKKFCCRKCASSYNTKIRVSKLPVRVCKVCEISFKPTNYIQKYCSNLCCSSLQVERSYKYLNGNFYGYILLLIKKEERKHLKVEDILEIYNKQNGLCAISKVPLTCIKIPKTTKVHTNLSIDRIDSNKGYELDNIQLVCAIINTMKLNLSMDEFAWWVKQAAGGLENSKF